MAMVLVVRSSIRHHVLVIPVLELAMVATSCQHLGNDRCSVVVVALHEYVLD